LKEQQKTLRQACFAKRKFVLPRSEHPGGEAMKKNKMDRQAADRRKSRLLKVGLC